MAGTDFSHLTNDELIKGIQALNLPDYIRSKAYGIDVRETLAQMTEMTIQLGVNMGLSPDDALKWARKLQESVSQSDFDSWVATLLDGGPSIFMNTLSELQTTYPNGAAGVALVRETDPAKIYVWNGSEWEDFGDYQGIEIKEGAVTSEKIADRSITPVKTTMYESKTTFNLANPSLILDNKKLSGLDTYSKLSEHIINDTNNLVVSPIQALPQVPYVFNGYGHFAFYDTNDNILAYKQNVSANKVVMSPVGTVKMAVQFSKTHPSFIEKEYIQIEQNYVLSDFKSHEQYFLNTDYLDEQSITPEKTSFFTSGKNLANPKNVLDNKKLRDVSSTYKTMDTIILDDLDGNLVVIGIPVKTGKSYVANTYGHFVFYKATGEALYRVTNVYPNEAHIAPSEADYLAIQVSKTHSSFSTIDKIQVEENSYLTEFEPFGMKLGEAYYDKGVSESEATPVKYSRLTRLPINANGERNFNTASFIQDNLTYFNGFQYAVWWSYDRRPIIAKRAFPDGEWETFDLSTVEGNPLSSPVADDGHNVIVVAVSEDGHVHVTGDHHGHYINYAVTTVPGDITSFKAGGRIVPDELTYPRFFKAKGGTLFLAYRKGSPLSGDMMLYKYEAGAWSLVQNPVINGSADEVNAYLAHIAVDNYGTIHVSGTWRNTSLANSAHHVYYARSTDNGVTWENSKGVNYTMPIRYNTIETPVVTALTGSGIVNQFGLEADDEGNPHVAYFKYDEDGNTNIYHLYNDGENWFDEKVTDFKKALDTSGNMWLGEMSRPSIFTYKNRVFILYRVNYDGKEGVIRLKEVTPGSSQRDIILFDFNLGLIDVTFDSQMLYREGKLSMLLTKNHTRAEISNLSNEYDNLPAFVYTIDLDYIDTFLNGIAKSPYVQTVSSATIPLENLKAGELIEKFYQGMPMVQDGETYMLRIRFAGNVPSGATLTVTMTDGVWSRGRLKVQGRVSQISDWQACESNQLVYPTAKLDMGAGGSAVAYGTAVIDLGKVVE